MRRETVRLACIAVALAGTGASTTAFSEPPGQSLSGPADPAAACQALRGFADAKTLINSAVLEPEAPLKGVPAFPPPPAAPIPAHCRVQGILKPTADSNIAFEVWLPARRWNGRFHGAGNGGFAGTLNIWQMAQDVLHGYAAATTDAGHSDEVSTELWARSHPEVVRDYAYRAIHLTAQVGKRMTAAFYGRPARHAYFSSCSNGGRQGLMEAQRFPEDYDGIIAGAPGYDFTRMSALFAWDAKAALLNPAATIPPSKAPAVQAAVLAQCGSADGLVDDPLACRFDPGILQCKGQETDACLTAPQVAAMRKIYQGPRTSHGVQIFPGFVPGGEVGVPPGGGWDGWIFGTSAHPPTQFGFALGISRDLARRDLGWRVQDYDFDRDPRRTEAAVGALLNANSPDLKRFASRGGKLILFHGWSDPALPPKASIQYYAAVRTRMGAARTDSFVRLFMIPGMQHCGFGPGAYWFNGVPAEPSGEIGAALERWVEEGKAPDQLRSAHPVDLVAALAGKPGIKVSQTALICAWPAKAVWNGRGDPKAAENYSCRVPEHRSRPPG